MNGGRRRARIVTLPEFRETDRGALAVAACGAFVVPSQFMICHKTPNVAVMPIIYVNNSYSVPPARSN